MLKVKIDSLKGKQVGLYFSGSWCGPCRRFTPTLVEVYNEVFSKGDFEVVFASADEDEESFQDYFSKMPWLAIPFSDSDTRGKLDSLFEVMGIPFLVILDENGKVLTTDGVEIIQEYGADLFPFSSEKIRELKEQEERARREQSLKSLLVYRSRDFVVSANGEKVSISELEGKTIGLYFSMSLYRSSSQFTEKLIEVYKKLKEKRENFEVVMVPLDEDEESFTQDFRKMPWLSLPFKDKLCGKLGRYFELSNLPTLVIIGPDGKTLHPDVAETVEEHGDMAYPFTPEKFAELEEIERAKREAQTLQSILVSGGLDFVIGKDGIKVPVTHLVGKHILLYFSAHWCPPCRAFMPKLVEAYHQIKDKHEAVEVIFISSDSDETEFQDFFAKMPWLALPFGDDRKKDLERIFKVRGIPMVVALDPSGKTITTEARELIMAHGSEVYPFTEARLKEIEGKYDDMAKDWPKKVTHELHEHELALTRREVYICDGCDEDGKIWSFVCEECEFDLHPKCALEEKESKGDDEDEVDEKKGGWVCDGEVCFKA